MIVKVPAWVTVVVRLLPIVSVPAVIRPNSVAVSWNVPAPPFTPIVSAMLVAIATVPVDPVLILPVKLSEAEDKLIFDPVKAELMVKAPEVVNCRLLMEPTPV